MKLEDLGWQSFFSQQVGAIRPDGFTSERHLPARVCGHHAGQIEFLTTDGVVLAPTSIIEPAGSQDESTTSIAVGDWYLLDADSKRATQQLERKSLLHRRAAGESAQVQLIASNVDTVFVVSSCNQDFNLSRIERYLAMILESGASPVVILTKSDLCVDAVAYRQQVEQIQSGMIVETLDSRSREQVVAQLEHWCGAGQTVALLGSSGVGKSTLINTLGGFQQATAEIREDDAKGRHTTTRRSMFRLDTGAWLIDTPGMREIQLTACEDGLQELFADVLSLTKNCRFRDCTHRTEPGCAIQQSLETGELDVRRWNNFQKLESEQRRNSESISERRERGRRLGKMYKNIINQKKSRRDS